MAKKFDTKDLRNVVFLAHNGVGKTTLGDVILLDTQVTNRLGSVDDDTSSFDSEPEEHKRKTTLAAKLGHVEWKKTKINFVDTPGGLPFHAETRMACAAADSGILLVSAPDGVQVGTEKTWSYLDDDQLPRAVVINKMDRERADFANCYEEVRKVLSDKCVAVELPLGKEASFEGAIDLVAMKAYKFAKDGSGGMTTEDIPGALADEAKKAREKLVDAVAASDEALTEKYLEAGDLSPDDLTAGLTAAINKLELFPVLCTAVKPNIGVQPLLDFLVRFMPAPNQRPARKVTDAKGEAQQDRAADENAPFCGVVFKAAPSDLGRLNLVRVVSGKLAADSNVVNVNQDTKERTGSLYLLNGKQRETVGEVSAGDLLGLAKLKVTGPLDTLCDEKSAVKVVLPAVPEPVISFAIKPKSKADEDKLSARLHDVIAEDVGLKVGRDASTKDHLLSGMGQAHVEAAVDKLRRLGVDVELLPPRVPYLEAIKGRAQNVEGKHKKQTGGKGQFGVCYIHMEPTPRGSGFQFEDAIVGGSIPREFIPAVEKGIRERMNKGVIAGFPVVDVKVTLVDGKYHDVDSDSRSFAFAGSKAFFAAFKASKPILLEPIMTLEVTCPSDNMGDVIGDLNSRRGRVLGMDTRGRNQVIKAQVPMSETLKYAADLRSVTGGRGSFTMSMSHYDELPPQMAEKVVAASKVEAEED
jgi:elongation factor G